MSRLRLTVIGQSLVWLLILSATARGFDCIAEGGGSVACPGPRWANAGAVLQVSLGTSSTPLTNGTGSWDQNALNAANDWNAVGAGFQFSVQFVPGGTPCAPSFCPNSPGENPVFFASSVCGHGFGDIVAQTNNCWDQNGHMINAPVFVNSNVLWDGYDGPLRPPVNDIHRVLLHEFGHVLGLGHPDQLAPPQAVVAIMNSGESNLYLLQPDDIDGIRSLYPNTGSPNATSSCRIAPEGASGAGALALPALLLALPRRRRAREGGASPRLARGWQRGPLAHSQRTSPDAVRSSPRRSSRAPTTPAVRSISP